jgi:hypothetical protein
MTDRPLRVDLELDAIDEAFKAAISQAYRDLIVYDPKIGVGPKTVEEAKKLAGTVISNARKQRDAAIAIITESGG